jgi:hypothetical protein
MNLPIYQQIASALAAANNCETSGNTEWYARHHERIEHIVRDHLPSGSGFDAGSHLVLSDSSDDRLTFSTSFHHMNSDGYYEGWTHHMVIVTPSLASGFNIEVTGEDHNGINDYIGEVFHSALSEVITH